MRLQFDPALHLVCKSLHMPATALTALQTIGCNRHAHDCCGSHLLWGFDAENRRRCQQPAQAAEAAGVPPQLCRHDARVHRKHAHIGALQTASHRVRFHRQKSRYEIDTSMISGCTANTLTLVSFTLHCTIGWAVDRTRAGTEVKIHSGRVAEELVQNRRIDSAQMHSKHARMGAIQSAIGQNGQNKAADWGFRIFGIWNGTHRSASALHHRMLAILLCPYAPCDKAINILSSLY